MTPSVSTETELPKAPSKVRNDKDNLAADPNSIAVNSDGSTSTSIPQYPKFDDPLKEREHRKKTLARAYRIFGRFGFDEGVAGHLTYRDPIDTHAFWVGPFGKAFSLMKSSDLILVSHEGKILEGGPIKLLNRAAFAIHSEIHKARPEANAACHSHSLYGKTFATLGRQLDITTQDSCNFYNDIALYAAFGGVVLAGAEGQNIAKTLGDKKAIILQNHGILTVGQTIESATFNFIALEKHCQVQLLADAANGGPGKSILIPEAEARFTYQVIGGEKPAFFNASPLFEEQAHRDRLAGIED